MPDERFFHKRLGHSAKVNSLSDFEDRVWRAYVLSADDFGVMRFSAVQLQADHDYCAVKPAKVVQRALERVRSLGLVQVFNHQGHPYCFQWNWQTHQHIKHPRQTINPKPSDELLTTCDANTQALFRHWPGKKKEKVLEDSGNSSEAFGHLARAGARETANGLQLPADGHQPTAQSMATRAGNFAERYADLHQRFVGSAYLGNPRKDYEAGLQLCERWTDAELNDMAIVWFGVDDDFATNGTRTIPKFASRATWCAQQVKAKGIA